MKYSGILEPVSPENSATLIDACLEAIGDYRAYGHISFQAVDSLIKALRNIQRIPFELAEKKSK